MAFRPPGKAQTDPGPAVLGNAEACRPQSGTEPADSGPACSEPNDRGAGTVAALAICMVLLGLSVGALVMVQASVAAVRAATAADLAALAGADALRGLSTPGGFPADGLGAGTGAASTTGDACGVAGEVAVRNNAVLRDCGADLDSGTVTVETEVRVPALPVPAAARARAGPPG